ncbi:GLUG motif-containing protein [Lysinibacillus sp. CTST325]
MFSGGTGTKDAPFLIKTIQDLINVRIKNNENPRYYYKQVADIDLSGVEWLPIGGQGQAFCGTYNGGGYTISNLTITEDIGGPAFISSAIEATLLNITIDNAYITNTLYNWIAILVSQTNDCTITNCHVTGKMESTNVRSSTGGLVSSAGTGTIINKCSANVDITAGLAGGFVCYSNAVIKDCYVTGKISGVQDEDKPDDKYIKAGTFAYILYSGNVENCYTSVEIYNYSSRSRKQLYVFAENYGAEINSCYCDVSLGVTMRGWSSDLSYIEVMFIRGTDNKLYFNYKSQYNKDRDYWEPEWNSTGPPSWWPKPYYRAQPITGEVWPNFWKQVTLETHPEARTTTEMQTQSTFDGWDFDTVWTIDEGKDYPRFKLKITQIKCKRMSLTNYGR